MVVSFIRKVNGTFFWLVLEIFDNVMLVLDSLINTKKGARYSEEDIHYIKKENRKLVKDIFCKKKQKPQQKRRTPQNDNPENQQPRPQPRGNGSNDSDSDDDKPSYNPRKQKMHSFKDYGSTDGQACSIGGG